MGGRFRHLCHDLLARQGPTDEDHLAVVSRNTNAPVRHGTDVKLQSAPFGKGAHEAIRE